MSDGPVWFSRCSFVLYDLRGDSTLDFTDLICRPSPRPDERPLRRTAASYPRVGVHLLAVQFEVLHRSPANGHAVATIEQLVPDGAEVRDHDGPGSNVDRRLD